MSWLDFLRKKKETKQESNIINISELNGFVKNELETIANKTKKVQESVRQKISNLISELNDELDVLQKISLKEKKENDRIKNIVLENLRVYHSYLKKLIENLENLQLNEEYLRNISSLLEHFNKKSRQSFEKATILIGKELEKVRNSLRNFTKDFNETLSENKSLFDKEKLLHNLNSTLAEFKNEKCMISTVVITNLEKDLKDIAYNKKEIEKKIEDLTQSMMYKKIIETREQWKQEISILYRENTNLKQDLNLKALAKYFHKDLRKRTLIKSYTDNFTKTLKEDKNLEIMSLLKEAKIKFNEEIIKRLQYKNLRSHEWQETEAEKQLNALEEEKKQLLSNIERIEMQIEQEKKKKEKLQKKIEKTIEIIKNQAKQLWDDKEIIF